MQFLFLLQRAKRQDERWEKKVENFEGMLVNEDVDAEENERWCTCV
jgi:hypothetical protein